MVFIPGGEFFRGRSQALSDDNLKWYPTLMKDDRVVPALQLQGGGWRSARVDPPRCSRPRVASLVAAPNAPVLIRGHQ
jgi:hypothetical protein